MKAWNSKAMNTRNTWMTNTKICDLCASWVLFEKSVKYDPNSLFSSITLPFAIFFFGSLLLFHYLLYLLQLFLSHIAISSISSFHRMTVHSTNGLASLSITSQFLWCQLNFTNNPILFVLFDQYSFVFWALFVTQGE